MGPIWGCRGFPTSLERQGQGLCPGGCDDCACIIAGAQVIPLVYVFCVRRRRLHYVARSNVGGRAYGGILRFRVHFTRHILRKLS